MKGNSRLRRQAASFIGFGFEHALRSGIIDVILTSSPVAKVARG